MEKLSDFLLHSDLSISSDGLPILSKEEEKDVMEQLGVSEKEAAEKTGLELIMAKMKNVREFTLATGEAAKEVENDEDYADYGTVIIKTQSGKSTQGTLRVKKGDDRFGSIIFRGGDVEPNDLPSDAYSTMRVIETAGGDESKPLWASASSSTSDASAESNFFWRAPETWEVNIIALERGEWAEDMPEEAFRKYKKERPKLGGIFRGQSLFFSAEQTAVAVPQHSSSSPALMHPEPESSVPPIAVDRSKSPSSAPTSPRGTIKSSAAEKTEKEPKSEKTSKKTKSGGKKAKSSEKEGKSKDKEKEKDKEKDKERERSDSASNSKSSSSNTSSSGSGSSKERKWAVFKRSTEARQRMADS